MPPLRTRVTVRVPATSANLGSGFDCLGFALQLFNDVTLSTVSSTGAPLTSSFSMTAVGEGADSLPLDATNLVARGARLAFHAAGYTQAPGEEGWEGLPPVHFHLINRIPIAAGLGSSSAAIVAGLLAGLTLTGVTMNVENEERLLQLAASVEGHPDNLAPCIYGGMQIGIHTGERFYTSSVPLPTGLQCILFIPDQRQSTEGARAILPPTVSRADAVFNIGRAAMFVNALATGQLGDLGLATEDALHQNARAAIMPALLPVIAAARKAGALGAFLSGAGSSILALTSGRKGDPHSQSPSERRDVGVAKAMVRGARSVGMKGRVLITQPCMGLGAHVVELDGDEGAVVAGKGLQFLEEEGEVEEEGKIPSSSGGAQPSPSPPPHSAASPAAASLAEDAAWVAQARSNLPSSSSTPPILYSSTRSDGSTPPLTFSAAVFAGTAPDGGLYVPTHTPHACLTPELLDALEGLPYHRVAARLLSVWVEESEVPLEDWVRLAQRAYSVARWGSSSSGGSDGGGVGGGASASAVAANVAPLVSLPITHTTHSGGGGGGGGGELSVLELFHGPTAAFKDVALQLLGELLPYLMARGGVGIPQRVTVLGATSGDTGAAAVAGLRGAPGVSLVILHPAGKVAPVQHMQMTSVLEPNVHNVAVGGVGADFDACQSAVKGAFGDAAFVARHNLCAINSINWARVLAQSVYYVYAVVAWRSQARKAGKLTAERIYPTFVVPTGNFGNALAGYYGTQMLASQQPQPPILAATNANDAVARALSQGDYARGVHATRPTLAPSMDISVSSNFERALYHAALECSGGGVRAACERVRVLQGGLGGALGSNPLGADMLAALGRLYTSASINDSSIDATIATVLKSTNYALCPHTAAGWCAAAPLALGGNDALLLLATAHPAKFASGTPALAQHSTGRVYAREVEGMGEGGGGASDTPVVPALPQHLRGLHTRAQRCLAIKMRGGEGAATALCKAVQSLCDTLVQGLPSQ